MSKDAKKVLTHRWQFVPPDFTGWPDGRPWTRIEAGPFVKGQLPEGADGPVGTMPQKYIDDLAEYLLGMVKTFEIQKNETEAAWHRSRIRSENRTMLVRCRLVPDPACEGVPLTPTESAP